MPDPSPLPSVARRSLLRAALAAPLLPLARPALARPTPRPFSARIVESGHSLTDPIMQPLYAMAHAVGGLETQKGVIQSSNVPGSPMEWRWNKRNDYPPDARTDIADFDVLVITERVSLAFTVPYHNSNEYALRWFNHAWENGNGGRGAETILYASWIEVSSGPDYVGESGDPEIRIPFRERLDLEMRRWQEMADYVNAGRPAGSPEMTVIPGPLIMAAVYDAIQAGTAPVLTDIKMLFSDEIHINDLGAYLIALAHFSVIYRRDPREVPPRLASSPVPPPELAAWMKDTVADVLRSYPGSGLTGAF